MITLLVKQLADNLSGYTPFKRLKACLPQKHFQVHVEGPQAGFVPFLLDRLHREGKSNTVVVLPSEQEAQALVQDLTLFEESRGSLFPWWGTVPYRQGHPLPSVFGDRVRILHRLLQGQKNLLILSLRAFLSPLSDPEYLARQVLDFSIGDTLDHGALARRLQAFAYLRVPRVSLRGEFALRGEVVDIFPFGEEEAIRLLLDFDRITEIRQFNPLTQASTQVRKGIKIFPTRELIFDQTLLDRMAGRLLGPENTGNLKLEVRQLCDDLAIEPDRSGAEYLYPLCFDRQFSLLDYMEGTFYFIDSERLKSSAAALQKEYRELFRQAAGSANPAPQQLLLDLDRLLDAIPRQVHFHSIKKEFGAEDRIRIESEAPRSFFGNITYLKEELENLISLNYRIYIFAVYEHQAARIRHLLKDLEVEILPVSISSGFSLPQFKIMVIQENEIFGRKRRIPRSVIRSSSRPIDSFVDLNPGDYVVHINYGIGLFNGIERIKAAGRERDYIHLEYDGDERIYLPVEQVNLIQRWVGSDGKKPRLDKIGGRGWEAKKQRVKRSVEDLARSLVNLYSRRQAGEGFAFPADSDWQAEFEAAFPFQETEDQLRCIAEVKEDMERPQPMDRLICGDVGYGKTEIALRAAFKAVMGGKQVALLAPTTILVEQHFENFQERFRRYPVSMKMLSRFVDRKEQHRVAGLLADGQCDIVIGTHRLIQKDIHFHNLGLLVVDEEQRFGVKDKERLKELKTNVDCLTLTATPIPRTLHMSLTKIRDMSILNTPPQNRLPIETFIQEFDEEVIVRAIRGEVERGGQIYYLHNRVQTMPQVYRSLTKLLPEIGIEIAHGQMESDELEEIMHRFVHGDIDMLLSTSIIESGLDIPNVNTIIIDRADMFGISQLYQLRGRVGRSDRPAYAYLFYPQARAMSELAMKRLKIISDFTELGSGFKIALKDLEIRGAGNLLGREQHGDILAVGLDMYLRLLDDAIEELGEGKSEAAPEVFLELDYSGYIPDTYIEEPMEKMEVYKKIASIDTEQDLDAVHRELVDRFGHLPDEVESLFAIAETRVLCKRLYISSLRERSGSVRVEFSKMAHLELDKVLTLIKESGGSVGLDPRQPNCLLIDTSKIELNEKSGFISERLLRLI